MTLLKSLARIGYKAKNRPEKAKFIILCKIYRGEQKKPKKRQRKGYEQQNKKKKRL